MVPCRHSCVVEVVQQQHAALSAEMEGLAAQLDARTRRVIELEATGSEAQTSLRTQLLEARAAAEATGREGKATLAELRRAEDAIRAASAARGETSGGLVCGKALVQPPEFFWQTPQRIREQDRGST